MKQPKFWQNSLTIESILLQPVAWGWRHVAQSRFRAKPRHVIRKPVICVGNFVAGGAGKTPTVIALVQQATREGLRPVILSRGYGGSERGPILVREGDRARDVGDEPLIHVQYAPTIVAKKRWEAVPVLNHQAFDLVIMDDGFQSRQIASDFNLIVIDGHYGIGNGATLPAGPLRLNLQDQCRSSDAVLIIERTPQSEPWIRILARHGLVVGDAHWHIHKPNLEAPILPALAFCGIARPRKFYESLAKLGIPIARTVNLGDHKRPSANAAQALLAEADEHGYQLWTTRKDHARLAGEAGPLWQLARAARILDVALEFEDSCFLKQCLTRAFQKYRYQAMSDVSRETLPTISFRH